MRIVSLAPSNTEILYALGAEHDLIAVTRFCDHPRQARQKQAVSGWTDVDIEKIAGLNADLIITSTIVQAEIAKKLKERGMPVLHLNPVTLDDVFESFLLIGVAINKAEDAKKLVDKTKRELGAAAAGQQFGKKLYVEEWHKPPTASGNWVTDLLHLIGCPSVLKHGEISRPVTAEEVRRYNPDAIVLSWCGFGTKARPDWVREREGWNTIPAVQKGKIFILDDSLLNRPGPRLVAGLKGLIRIANEV